VTNVVKARKQVYPAQFALGGKAISDKKRFLETNKSGSFNKIDVFLHSRIVFNKMIGRNAALQ
jgi:hypothetical protein